MLFTLVRELVRVYRTAERTIRGALTREQGERRVAGHLRVLDRRLALLDQPAQMNG